LSASDEDAVPGVSPAAAALVSIGDEVPIHAVDLDGDGEYIRVVALDVRPSGLLPASVVARWLRRLTEADRDARDGRAPAALLGETVRALRATAVAGIALREGEGVAGDDDVTRLLEFAVTMAERLVRP
jgi:hypothetical protein